jgi:2-polyprenyl-6-methoxyphenol hydroxylase-like FAD-dependent oxidoreductase
MAPAEAQAQNGRPFRIIVVGAGLTGLVVANCLQKLGIDHIVLEKGNIAPPKGGIALWPHSLRILYQLGVMDKIKKVSRPTIGFKGRGSNGLQVYDTQMYHCVEEKSVQNSL